MLVLWGMDLLWQQCQDTKDRPVPGGIITGAGALAKLLGYIQMFKSPLPGVQRA